MAKVVDYDDNAPDEDDQADLLVDVLLDVSNEVEIKRDHSFHVESSRRRIENYTELRRMRDELDDPFFDFD